MVEVATRTLRDYLSTLTDGGSAGVIDQNLDVRNDFVSEAQAVPAGGTVGQVLVKASNVNFDTAWVSLGSGAGDMQKVVYDPQSIEADVFDRANHTGFQSYTTISGLGTAATQNVGAFADNLQGAKADTAVQPGSLATVATSGSYTDLTDTPNFGSLALKNTVSVPSDITAGGTASLATYLRGDGQWATPPGSILEAAVIYQGDGSDIEAGEYPIILYNVVLASIVGIRIRVFTGSGSLRVAILVNGNPVSGPTTVIAGTPYSGTVSISVAPGDIVSASVDMVSDVSALNIQLDGGA